MTGIGVIEGVAGNAVWAYFQRLHRTFRRWRYAIAITSPRFREVLSGGEALGEVISYPVAGTMKKLPTDHEIWLLTQHEPTGEVWPQGFYIVQYNKTTRSWHGRISIAAKGNVKIIVVAAPPTAQDFFRYFQTVGSKRNFNFEPLRRIPPECEIQASVQAVAP